MEEIRRAVYERRQYKRIEKQVMTRLKDNASAGWNIIFTRNISAGGMLFNYTQRLDPGWILDFKITLSGMSNPIECTGEVVRSKPVTSLSADPQKEGIRMYETAAQFTQIRPAHSLFINHVANKTG